MNRSVLQVPRIIKGGTKQPILRGAQDLSYSYILAAEYVMQDTLSACIVGGSINLGFGFLRN